MHYTLSQSVYVLLKLLVYVNRRYKGDMRTFS